VFFSTAYQVYLPALVTADEMMEGNAKLQGSMSVALVSGRGLAGLAAEALGDATALLCNAVSFLVSAACLLSIRGAAPRPVPSGHTKNMWAEITEGTRFIVRDPVLRSLSAYPALANLGIGGGGSALFVVFLVRVDGFGSAAVGVLMAMAGIGGIAGALTARRVAARLGTARALLLNTVGSGLAGLLLPLTAPGPRVACFVVGALLVGAGMTGGNIIVTAFRQMYVPVAMLGRVTANQRFLVFGAVPVGALLAGGLGTALGVRNALWVMLAIYAVAPVVLFGRPVRGRRNLPAATLLPGEA
jgi:predicted MFS family arabinose efflux permease